MPRAPKIDRPVEHFLIIGGEIKATNDAKGIVEGYLNYIGNIDYGDDRTMPHAFDKTLQDSYARKARQDLEYLWPYLWNHDYNILPPGGIFDADEDRKGLYTKTQLNLDMQLGRELYSSFKMGTMKKQSMGYKAHQVEWVKEAGRSIRNLLEVEVREGSSVVFPMNDLAQVDTVKNRRNFYMSGKLLPTKQEMPAITKDYATSYAEVMQQDWCSDLWNLWYPLRNEIILAFQTGDTIEADVSAALKQFAPAVMSYVARGVELNMTECLQPADEGDSGGSMPMMMSRDDNPETMLYLISDLNTKDAKLLSAASHAKMTKAVQGMEGHMKELKTTLAAQRANQLQGYRVYSGNEPPEQKEDESEEDETPEQKEEQVEDIHSVLHDLTLLLSADNANRAL